MPKFIALISSEPCCDSSAVGCGKSWIELASQTSADAMQELRQLVVGDIDLDDGDGRDGEYFWKEQRLSDAILLEVSGEKKAHVSEWYNEADAELLQARNAKNEAEERKMFERLRDKFGDKP